MMLKTFTRSVIIGILTFCLEFHAAWGAESVPYQNWVVEIGNDTAEAYVVNDSSSSLGLFCSNATCVFYLNANLNCQPQSKYSVLLNSEAIISTALTMQCTQIGGHYFQILDPFDAVMRAVNSGEVIGFAVALQGGSFAVVRFPTSGAKAAITRVREEAAKGRSPKISPPANQAGSRDIIL